MDPARWVYRFRIFISSPGDLTTERQLADEVIDRLNRNEYIRRYCVLEPLRFEHYIPPVMGQGPQRTVDQYMAEASEVDLLITLLWTRMGTPVVDQKTGRRFSSGTEYEWVSAYEAYQRTGRPAIFLYRCVREPGPNVDPDQYRMVDRFFREIESGEGPYQGYFKRFHEARDFERALHDDLHRWLHGEIQANEEQAARLTGTRDNADPGPFDARTEKRIEAYRQAFIQDHRGLDRLFIPLTATWVVVPEDPWAATETPPRPDSDMELWRRLDTDEAAVSEPSLAVAGAEPADTVSAPALELLGREPQVILLGDPGAGKSTCLKKLALDRAKAFKAGGLVTVYVSLNEYTEEYRVWDLVQAASQLTPYDLDRLAEDERLELLLDGFNEMAPARRLACCWDIMTLFRTYPRLRLVLAARPETVACRFELPTLRLQALNTEQRQALLAVYLNDTDRAAALLEELEAQPAGALLSGSPILLTLVAEVSRQRGAGLPEGQAQLYRRFAETTSDLDFRRQGWARLFKSSWNNRQLLSGLAKLAFLSRLRGWVAIPEDWAKEVLQEDFKKDAGPIVERFAEGILLERDQGEGGAQLRFYHETLQEYFCAEHLIRVPEALANAHRSDRAAWAMPLTYACELERSLPVVLLEAAWSEAPLLLSFALRDSRQLQGLPLPEYWNPWLRALIEQLRADDPPAVPPETALIGNSGLDVPPLTLTTELAAPGLSYAAATHAAGKARLERLLDLIARVPEPWADLLPALLAGQPALKDRLTKTWPGLLAAWGLIPRDPEALEAVFPALDLPVQLRLLATAPRPLKERLWPAFDTASLTSEHISTRAWYRFLRDTWLTQRLPLERLVTNAQRTRLRQSADAALAKALVRTALVRPEAFTAAQRQGWLEAARIGQVIELIRDRLVARPEVPAYLVQRWVDEAGPDDAVALCHHSFAVPTHFAEDRRRHWIASANSGQAVQLIHSGIATSADFSAEQKRAWLRMSRVEEVVSLLRKGVLTADDLTRQDLKRLRKEAQQSPQGAGLLPHLPAPRRGLGLNPPKSNASRQRIYRVGSLEDPDQRAEIERQIGGRTWSLRMFRLLDGGTEGGTKGFALHPQFPDRVYVTRHDLQNVPGRLRLGDEIKARIGVAPRDAQETRWSYRARSGTFLRSPDPAIPAWWLGWRYWAPLLIDVGRGAATITASDYARLEQEAFPHLEALRAWAPDAAATTRLEHAQTAMAGLLEELRDGHVVVPDPVTGHLAGDGPWTALQTLAHAFVRGHQLFYPAGLTDLRVVSPQHRSSTESGPVRDARYDRLERR